MQTASKKDDIIQTSRRFPVLAMKPADINRGSRQLGPQKRFNGERGLIMAQPFLRGKRAEKKLVFLCRTL
jgi:hypothetical protein